MREYQTRQLKREELLAELQELELAFAMAGAPSVLLSFGWDSNLPIEQMWKEQNVLVSAISDTLREAERRGVFSLGKADVFLEGAGLAVQLCHEGDLHVKGESASVEQVVSNWRARGYEPQLVSRPA